MNYLRALVLRYSGDIQAYGLWNEPNQGNWKGSPESYVERIVNPAAVTIKTACPACQVVAGDLLHSEASCRLKVFGRCLGATGEEKDWRTWMHAILTSAAFTDGHIDIISHHIYTDSNFANVASLSEATWIGMALRGRTSGLPRPVLTPSTTALMMGTRLIIMSTRLRDCAGKGYWVKPGKA